jgi:hypothetical protein
VFLFLRFNHTLKLAAKEGDDSKDLKESVQGESKLNALTYRWNEITKRKIFNIIQKENPHHQHALVCFLPFSFFSLTH